jgi:hypothetical protein
MAAAGALEELPLMAVYKGKLCFETWTVLLVPNFV